MLNFKGEKASLRPVRADDLPFSLMWRNDPEFISLNMALRKPVTEEMERKWIEKILSGDDNTKIVYAIEDISSNQIIGFIVLAKIDWISRTAELGISISNKDKRGKGVGKEVVGMILEYAFNFINLRKLTLVIAGYNLKSKLHGESMGFKLEAVLKEQIYFENKYHDVYLLSLFQDEYFRKIESTRSKDQELVIT